MEEMARAKRLDEQSIEQYILNKRIVKLEWNPFPRDTLGNISKMFLGDGTIVRFEASDYDNIVSVAIVNESGDAIV